MTPIYLLQCGLCWVWGIAVFFKVILTLETSEIFFFFFPVGLRCFQLFLQVVVKKNSGETKQTNKKKKESTQLTSSCNLWILRYYVEVLIT